MHLSCTSDGVKVDFYPVYENVKENSDLCYTSETLVGFIILLILLCYAITTKSILIYTLFA